MADGPRPSITLDWNLQNLVTVTLMVVLGFAAVGLAIKFTRAQSSKNAPKEAVA